MEGSGSGRMKACSYVSDALDDALRQHAGGLDSILCSKRKRTARCAGDEAAAAFGDESVLDEMRLRVEQAQREAARHESNLAAFRDEADDAQRAAAEAQRLQMDLLQVQRQLAGWVLDLGQYTM